MSAAPQAGVAVTPERQDTGSGSIVAIAACGAAIASLLPVALYQLGTIKHLPDPPGTVFDSDAITASETAHPLGVPDSLPGLVSYAATLALLLLARRERVAAAPGRPQRPLARRLLGAKLLLDGGLALVNVVRQIAVFRRLCSWCTATAVCTGVMVYSGRDCIADLRGAPGARDRGRSDANPPQLP